MNLNFMTWDLKIKKEYLKRKYLKREYKYKK